MTKKEPKLLHQCKNVIRDDVVSLCARRQCKRRGDEAK